MPPKSKPPQDGLSRVKMFASSKREPGVKMIKTTNRTPSSSAPQSSSRNNDLKAEFEALSQGKKPLSTLPIEVFDLSDSEAESGGGESSKSGFGSKADGTSLEQTVRNDDDEEYNNDGNDTVTAGDVPLLPAEQMMGSGNKGDRSSSADLQSASSSTPRRKNTARCSRGRGGRKVNTSSEATMRKISSFKPMKPRPGPSAVAASDTLNGAASEEIVAPSASPPPPSRTKVVAQEADTTEGDTTVVIPPADRHGESDSPSPDEDTGSEEFHELPEFRRSMSRHTEEAEPPATNKRKRKTTAFEGSYDSDLPLAKTIIRRSQPPSPPDAAAAVNYVSKDEFDRTISALREEMRQEVDKMREAMRIETKRLIRAEVKDEILLTQEQKS